MITIRTIDDETNREIEEPVTRDRDSGEHGTTGSRVDTFAAIRAHRGAELARWNYGRRQSTRTAWNVIATPFALATYYPIHLDTEVGYEFDRYSDAPDYDAARSAGGAFVCGSAGLYNLKAVFRGLLSAPAVVGLEITEVWFGYEFLPETPYDPTAHPSGYHELGASFSTIGQVPGAPPVQVQSFIQGWSIPGADKIAMKCGDMLRPVWIFQGAGQIEYLDNFFCRVALARVGDIPQIEQGCC